MNKKLFIFGLSLFLFLFIFNISLSLKLSSKNNNFYNYNHINNKIHRNNEESNKLSKLIHLHNDVIDTTISRKDNIFNRKSNLKSKESLYLVHLKGPIEKQVHSELVKQLNQIFNDGGEIIHYIPDNTYLVSMIGDSDNDNNSNKQESINRLKDLVPSIQWLKSLEPRLKVSPLFKQSQFQDNKNEIDQLRVYYHSHSNDNSNFISELSLTVAEKEIISKNNILITVDLKNTQLSLESIIYKLSTESLVYWIEPSSSKLVKHTPSNKFAHYSIQSGSATTTSTPIWDIVGIKGDGEVVGCADTGIDVNHCFFYDTNPIGSTHRKIVSYSSGSGDQTDEIDGHGTHIVGTILGSTTVDPTVAEFSGGAPNSKVAFVDLQVGGNTLSVQSNLTAIYQSTYDQKAKVHCDAWNSNIGPFYTGVTEMIDRFQWTHKDFLVVRSAGNNVNFGFNSIYTLSQESTSKNSLVVGSSNQPSSTFSSSINYWDWDFIYNSIQTSVCTQGQSVYGLACSDLPSLATSTDIQTQCCSNTVLGKICCSTQIQQQYQTNSTVYNEFIPSLFSGVGPTSDGRFKPDLLAPGSPIISSRSLGPSSAADHCSPITSGIATSALIAMEGSSQAAAVAASAAVLVRQYYRDGYFINGKINLASGFQPSASLVKATLINTASIKVDSTLDYSQGFGNIQLSKLITTSNVATTSLSVPSSIEKADPIINTGETNSYCFALEGRADIDITLVWTDPAGSPLSTVTLVNNLDLALLAYVDGELSIYSGNSETIFKNSSEVIFDQLNNVEVIRIKNAPIGSYDVKVFGTNVVIPNQSYSVVIRTSGGSSLMKESECAQCFYDPNDDQTQACEFNNGIGTQYCKENNQFSKCVVYECNTGYVFDNGITKSCVTTLALTLYDIVLLGIFGIIIVGAVIFVLVCYKSKSLDQNKYVSLSKDKGGDGNSARSNSMANNGKQSNIELSSVGGTPNGEEEQQQQQNNLPQYDEDGRLISGQEVEISIFEVISLGKPESKILGLALFLSFIDVALGLAVPLVAANIFDYLYSGETNNISTTILTFALIIIGMIIVQFLSGILLALAGHRIIARLRREMFASLLKQDMAFFNERKTGELMSRLASDVSSVRSIISDSIPHMIIQIATIGGTLIMLFIISWKLSLVVLCPLPILLIFSKFYGGYIEVISVKVQDALADAATHAAETLFNMKTVRWFSAEEREVAKFSKLIAVSYKIALKMTIWNGIYSSTSGIFEQLSVFILLWYGSSLVRNGDLTPSMLIAFNLFLPFITGAVTQVATLYTTYKSYKGSSYRFFEIMQRVPDIQGEGGITRNKVRGDIQFNQVNFAYSSNPGQLVLEKIDIKFEPGTITALIGPSGGGKSTMLSLIGRLYNIDGGSITLDGTNIKDFNVPNLHEHISIVNQEPSLFSGTIAENIMFGKPTATRAEIIEACKQANAHDFITAMPEGYDTLIGERGTALSGGQKQRIAIARTIIKNPTVLLLDETTSELDVESEKLVQDSIDKLVVGRTVIIVAHRLTTILTADIIAVVSDSTISEMGTPEELLAKKGMFYDFVQIQYGKQGEELDIQLPSNSRNTRNAERLRNRSETIKQIAKINNIIPMHRPRENDDEENDNSDEGGSSRSPPPMWRQAKKNASANKSMLLIRRNTLAQDKSGWQKGNVDDKLQRVLQKSRKKGFMNNQDHKDIKATLVLY
ncbi:hypothetical protein RB653_003665 [Dictyostelium firmibasis]|uniref:Uncharacterized protein n=1 Tax=Dictyostelium firmibasis TaxID=79012 RepID=A0AAN7YZB4_9MYCE